MKYREEMAAAILDAMQRDPKVVILGESVADPKGIFGTTLPASKTFPQRVIETPLSENVLTGACLGLALEGWKPIYVHARTEFMMPAMEQIVNIIAKWRFVHHDRPVHLVLRSLIGRGWGQGPTHSQAFHAMFAHIPGLRVLYPVDPNNLRTWFNDALSCGWPTIILESRRLYEIESIDYPIWENPDVSIVTFGDVVLDAAQVALDLDRIGIKAQVHPVEDVSALQLPETDLPTVIVDTGHLRFGAAAEVMARLAERGNIKTKRVGPPFIALPTSAPLEQEWYPSVDDIMNAVCDLLDIRHSMSVLGSTRDNEFRGPF